MNKLLTLFAALVVTTVSAKDYPLKQAGVIVSIPDNLGEPEVKKTKIDLRNKELFFYMKILKHKKIDKAFKQHKNKWIGELDKNPSEQNPQDFSYNGMTGIFSKVSGTHKGDPVTMRIYVMKSPNGKIIGMCLGTLGDEVGKDEALLRKIIESIRPL